MSSKLSCAGREDGGDPELPYHRSAKDLKQINDSTQNVAIWRYELMKYLSS